MNSRTLTYPFERYRETTLLAIGVAGLAVGSLIGYLCQMRYDGVIDAHISTSIRLYQPFADNLVNVLSLFLPLLALGYWINKKTRPVDILTAALLSRFPMYVLPLFNIGGALESSTAGAMEAVQAGMLQLPWQDTAFILLAGIVGLAAMVYAIILLYNGFRVATHLKKRIHQVAFAVAFIIAIILSKLAITQLALLT